MHLYLFGGYALPQMVIDDPLSNLREYTIVNLADLIAISFP